MAPTPLTPGRRPLPATTRRVLKALSLFTGVQSVNVLVAILRTKLVALWIGPAGVGLLSLYAWAMQLLTTATQFNIGQSAVRDISRCCCDEDRRSISALVRRLGLTIGAGGAIVTILLSPLLSRITFGDYSHTAAFIALGAVPALAAVTATEGAIMQGFERLKRLAASTLWGAVAGTAVAIPLYYFFRTDAIVPVLIVFALASCVSALVCGVRTGPAKSPTVAQALRRGRDMLRLGTYLTVSTFAGMAATYIFMVFLNRCYDESTVGVFNAGSTLLTNYVGIIFTAIAMEFYPRLSKVASSAMRTRTVVSHEASMALMVMCPVTVVVICCSGLIIGLLYSAGFSAAEPFVEIGIVAMIFKAPSWCMAYCMIARGHGRLFLVTECASAAVYIILSIVLFRLAGFAGLGAAYVLWYVIYFAIVYGVYRRRYGLSLSRGVWRQMFFCLAVAAATFVLVRFAGPWIALGLMLPGTAIVAFRYLRRR